MRSTTLTRRFARHAFHFVRRSFTLPPLANGFEVEFSFVKDDVGDVGVVGVELTALFNSHKLLLDDDPRR